jgi:hypothetical protein
MADLADVIERAKLDPAIARFDTDADVGGCWNTAHAFANHCKREGVPYRFRRWRNLPGQRTEYQHNVEVGGRVICFTHRQVDPSAAWPHVEPVEDYQARGFEPLPICSTCGDYSEPHTCRGLESMEAMLQRLADELTAGGLTPFFNLATRR